MEVKLLLHPRTLFYLIRRLVRQNHAKKIVKSYSGNVFVSGQGRGTFLSRQTELGNNTNFNGLEINGTGRVVIGDNFHSGIDCLIITQNHNYEGTEIPYDSTYIVKDVIIEDNVWLGDRVIILGGKNWRRSNYSGRKRCGERHTSACYSRRTSCCPFQV